MELFNEHKNNYFAVIQDIINDSVNGIKFTEEDIFRIFIKRGILKKNNKNNYENLELKDALLNKFDGYEKENKNLYLLQMNNDSVYRPIINKRVPIRASHLESQWLKMMIEDPIIKLLLDEKTIQNLHDRLQNIDSIYNQDYFLGKNIDASYEDIEIEAFDTKFKTLNKAIVERKFIKYTNEANNGKLFKDEVAFPFRIEYSGKDNKFRLSILSLKDERPVAINISNLKYVEIIDETNEALRKKALELIISKKAEQPLSIEVENKRNSVERCFYLFSCYEKDAYFDKEKNKHVLKMYYYKFDEKEIIKDILSLGSSVVVIEPESIRCEIIGRLKKHLKI